MPEWEYYFHGRGCCISHKVDGDAIDVDFWDDSAEYFDTFFYKNYLESLRRPEPPEQRLRELHPSARAVTIAINDLIVRRSVDPASRTARPTLPPRGRRAGRSRRRNRRLLHAWADPDRGSGLPP